MKVLPILALLYCYTGSVAHEQANVHLITVASEETDGLKRLRQSAEHFGYDLKVFGLGEKWNGGDMQSAGGGQKIKLLQKHLPSLQILDTDLILFVDAYDVIINGDIPTLLDRVRWDFADFRILFGAEPFCWPDAELKNFYPHVKFGERFLNSGLILGYAKEFKRMLDYLNHVEDGDDDQLEYTKLYLNGNIREDLKIGLDSLSRIFLNLNGQKDNVKLESGINGAAEIFNHIYNTHPLIIHGNGPSKILLSHFGNYIGGKHDFTGCQNCNEVKPTFSENLPTVTLSIFIAKPIPYVEEFLKIIENLSYDFSLIDLFVYNNQEYNKEELQEFLDKNGVRFKSTKVVTNDGTEEKVAREMVIEWSKQKGSTYFLSVDAEVHFSNPNALKLLIQQAETNDLSILSPVLLQPGKLFSNFWGAVSSTGFYARSDDYVDIVESRKKGIFNIPFVNGAILIHKDKLDYIKGAYGFVKDLDSDMSFAAYCRHYGHFMFVDNQIDYGFLVAFEFFEQLTPQTIHKEVYDYPNNQKLWESRYINPLYFDALKPETNVHQPCPDVFDFPFISKRLASEMIEIMNYYGQWSTGKNEDIRLAGGYENVPTRDIHMKQVGLHNQWLKVLDYYVGPMQEKLFAGYYVRPVHSDMMFVVRYKPEEQSFLRPHLDASTYSIDIALNQKGVDYEGGGVRYLRYNCTVPADEVGYSMIFPGRLTHMHEGLQTTKGTRYILVSFINP